MNAALLNVNPETGDVDYVDEILKQSNMKTMAIFTIA